MERLIIRVDASTHIGVGHLMRCLAFAQGLEKIGAGSIFVIRDYDQNISQIIRHYGYDVEVIGRDCSFKEDASLTSGFADQHNVSLIVTDLSNPDIMVNLDKYGEYLQDLKDTGKFLITIDDLNEMPFPSDIMINPNYGAESMNYKFSRSTKFLLGPAYFIFRQEFIESAKLNREIREKARNILVTIAGSDPLNLTVKVTKALCKLRMASNLNLRIVLGVGSPDSMKQELEKALKGFAGSCELLQGSDKMAELMLWSDLAITGGGLTKYETAVTGTPSIIISQAEHHVKLMEKFEKGETSLYLGLSSTTNEEDIAAATARLLRNYVLRAEMSKRGKKLVDGKGIERIILEIPQEVFS